MITNSLCLWYEYLAWGLHNPALVASVVPPERYCPNSHLPWLAGADGSQRPVCCRTSEMARNRGASEEWKAEHRKVPYTECLSSISDRGFSHPYLEILAIELRNFCMHFKRGHEGFQTGDIPSLTQRGWILNMGLSAYLSGVLLLHFGPSPLLQRRLTTATGTCWGGQWEAPFTSLPG